MRSVWVVPVQNSACACKHHEPKWKVFFPLRINLILHTYMKLQLPQQQKMEKNYMTNSSKFQNYYPCSLEILQ
jgi:hypothetical protein